MLTKNKTVTTIVDDDNIEESVDVGEGAEPRTEREADARPLAVRRLGDLRLYRRAQRLPVPQARDPRSLPPAAGVAVP